MLTGATCNEHRRVMGGKLVSSIAVSVCLAALICTLSADAQPRKTRPEIIGVPSVIDGDSIDIRGTNYRLWGIDAPEIGQFCGRERMGQRSANALSEIIAGRTLRCIDRGDGGWGRRVVHCTAAGQDIQARMVRDGWAYAFSKYSHDYEPQQAVAQRANVGVWAAGCQAPWDWRAERKKKKAA